MNTRARSLTSLAVAATLLASLGACSRAASTNATVSPTPTVTSTPTPTPTPPPVNVLTGLPGQNGPVLALKIDNTVNSLPHIGLTSADVVYVEEVEGGLTRLAAVYSSRLPKFVAPIRSARESDVEFLPAYGRIAFGFSGSVAGVHALVAKAGLVDVSADKSGLGYFRLSSRYAPYNETAIPKVLIKRARGSVPARFVGFTFGSAPAGGTRANGVVAVYPSARISMRYNPSTKTYSYSLGGQLDRSGQGQVAASTVIVQSVRLVSTGRDDVAGNPVPKSITVGKGKAVILRDGKAWKVTWSRPSVDGPTRWLYQGKNFPMRAGQTWVLLLNTQRSPRIITN